jgi:hypothetical protein
LNEEDESILASARIRWFESKIVAMKAILDKDPEYGYFIYNETTHSQSIPVRELGKY